MFPRNDRINWSFLAHLGYSMWADPVRDRRGVPGIPQEVSEVEAQDIMRFDPDLWQKTTAELAAAGCNMIVLDVGEGMQYESHPEISAKDAWSKEALAAEVRRLKALGIEAIPKLNFSASHDEWMGEYARMLSTTPYYRFCEDVITEVCEVFDRPRLFHIGMDEETYDFQRRYNVCVIRQGEQWWYDLRYLVGTVMRLGARPWMWCDRAWYHTEEFLRRMSRDIVQSGWCYDFTGIEGLSDFNAMRIRMFETLDRYGFDQVPTGSVWSRDGNLSALVENLSPILSKEHLTGYMQSVWRPMTYAHAEKQAAGVRTLGEAKMIFDTQFTK